LTQSEYLRRTRFHLHWRSALPPDKPPCMSYSRTEPKTLIFPALRRKEVDSQYGVTIAYGAGAV